MERLNKSQWCKLLPDVECINLSAEAGLGDMRGYQFNDDSVMAQAQRISDVQTWHNIMCQEDTKVVVKVFIKTMCIKSSNSLTL